MEYRILDAKTGDLKTDTGMVERGQVSPVPGDSIGPVCDCSPCQ